MILMRGSRIRKISAVFDGVTILVWNLNFRKLN
jgi:hypothetical protein